MFLKMILWNISLQKTYKNLKYAAAAFPWDVNKHSLTQREFNPFDSISLIPLSRTQFTSSETPQTARNLNANVSRYRTRGITFSRVYFARGKIPETSEVACFAARETQRNKGVRVFCAVFDFGFGCIVPGKLGMR